MKKERYSRNEQENKEEERKEEGKLQRKRKKDKRSNAERKRLKKISMVTTFRILGEGDFLTLE